MRKPKAPKWKKAPKQPKMTASKQTWDNYNRKLSEIENHNKKLATEYKKQMNAYEAEKKRRDKIRAKSKSGLGAI